MSTSQLAELIDDASRMVILTGAGISTESGVPDFRSPGGLWEQFRIVEYGEYVESEDARIEDWHRRFYMKDQIGAVETQLRSSKNRRMDECRQMHLPDHAKR